MKEGLNVTVTIARAALKWILIFYHARFKKMCGEILRPEAWPSIILTAARISPCPHFSLCLSHASLAKYNSSRSIVFPYGERSRKLSTDIRSNLKRSKNRDGLWESSTVRRVEWQISMYLRMTLEPQ